MNLTATSPQQTLTALQYPLFKKAGLGEYWIILEKQVVMFTTGGRVFYWQEGNAYYEKNKKDAEHFTDCDASECLNVYGIAVSLLVNVLNEVI